MHLCSGGALRLRGHCDGGGGPLRAAAPGPRQRLPPAPHGPVANGDSGTRRLAHPKGEVCVSVGGVCKIHPKS